MGDKCQCPTRVLFFDVPEQVRCVGDLRLDLLLAIAVVVVGDQRDDNSPGGPARGLERHPIVVLLTRILPTHAVATLSLGRLIPVAQPKLFLGQLDQVRGQDHATGVPCPMLDIQRCVVVGQKRIPRVSENRLDKVQVADQAPRRKETNLHRLLLAVPRNPWTNQRPDEQRNPRTDLLGPLQRKRDPQIRKRGGYRRAKQLHEHVLRYRTLVPCDRQSPLGDMKRPLGRPAVGLGIVQHSVGKPIGTDHIVLEQRCSIGQTQFPGHPMLAHGKRMHRQSQRRIASKFAKVLPEELLDPPIAWGLHLRDQTMLLLKVRQEPFGQLDLSHRLVIMQQIRRRHLHVDQLPKLLIRFIAPIRLSRPRQLPLRVSKRPTVVDGQIVQKCFFHQTKS